MQNLKRLRLILLSMLTCALALFGASCGGSSSSGNNQPPDSGITGGEEHVHAWDNGVETLAPTCDYDGKMTYTCATCGDTRVETIAAFGHTYDVTCHCGTCGTEQPVVENCVWDISKANDGSVFAKLYADTQSSYKIVITGTGEMKDFAENATPWVDYIIQVKIVIVTEGVSSVGNYAFANMPNLSTVSLPDSLTAFGSNVFANCENLTYTEQDGAYYLGNETNACIVLVKTVNVETTTIVMVDGAKFVLDEAFKNCVNLQTVSFSSTLLGIGANAFENCSALQEALLPDTLTALGESAFAGCVELKKVVVSQNITVIEINVFINCVKLVDIYLPDTIVVIKNGAFTGCGFPTINLPSSLEQIGDGAFKDCIYLEVIVIPDKVESIGSEAFSGSSIKEITIPESVTIIKTNVFLNCTYLVTIHIPETVTVIEVDAFKGCDALKEVIYTGSNEQWENIDKAEGWAETNITPIKPITTNYVTLTKLADGTYSITGSNTSLNGTVIIPDTVTVSGVEYPITAIGNQAFYNRSKITRIILPSSITSIGNYAFYGCSALKSVTIPETVTHIGNYAFYYCSALQTIKIPNAVTSIGTNAFQYCSALTSVTLSDSLTEISNNTFTNCTSLSSVTIPKSVTSIGTNAFTNCNKLVKLVIPENVTTIASGAFTNTLALQEIVLNASNLADFASNALAFTDAGKNAEWLKVTIGKNVEKVPAFFLYNSQADEVVFEANGVCTELGIRAFSCGIKAIELPATVTTLGNYSLAQLAMDSFTIPATVTSIGTGVLASSTIKEATILTEFTELPASTFSGCANLETVNLPDGIEIIGNNAFAGAGIKSFTLPDTIIQIGENAFKQCAIESIVFPESLTEIGKYGFSESGLKTVVVPNGIKLNEYVFSSCKSLESATLYTNVPQRGFANCPVLTKVVLGEGVTTIVQYGFYNCTNLITLVLPSTFTSNGADAFFGCNHLVEIYNLSSLNIVAGSSTYNYIADGALNVFTDLSTPSNLFYDGDLLCYKGIPDKEESERAYLIAYMGKEESVTLPEKIGGLNYDIYEYAFYSNKSVKNVVLPDTVTTIGLRAFYGCSKLETLYLGKSLKEVDSYAFANSNLVEITLPGTFTDTGYNSFSGCKKLAKVNFCEGITSIGSYSFASCSALVEIELPNSVTSIGTNAFSGCTSLRKVKLSSAVKSILANTFNNCSSLEEFILPNDTQLAEIATTAFQNANLVALEYENAYYLGTEENPYLILYKGIDNTATSFAIHPNTKTICSNAFANFTKLTEVTIPDQITSIGSNVFSGCTSLTTLSIPFLGLTKETSNSYMFSHLGANNVKYLTVRGGDIRGNVSETGESQYGAFYNNKSLYTVRLENVQSIGSRAFEYCTMLQTFSAGDGLETIGQYAFYACDYLMEITLPDTVTAIGKYAFHCPNVEEYTAPFIGGGANVEYGSDTMSYVFTYTNQSLKKVTITKGETIARNAFANFSSLETIYLPEHLTSIKENSFYNCTSLKNVYLGEFDDWFDTEITVASSNSKFELFGYAENVYFGDVLVAEADLVIPASVTKLSDYQLAHLKAKSLTIPATVTELSWRSCFGMTLDKLYYDIPEMDSLQQIHPFCASKIGTFTFGSNVKSVPSYVFACTNNIGPTVNLIDFAQDSICTEICANAFAADYSAKLNEVRLPSSLTTIGEKAFTSTQVKKINLPASLTSIAKNAFSGCYELAEVSVENFTALAQMDFSASPLQAATTLILDGVTATSDIVLPAVPRIGDCLFYNNSFITSITIPETVTTIGERAFYYCTSLQQIHFTGTPTLENLGSNCFTKTGLTSLTLPDSLKIVGPWAFQNCSALATLDLNQATEIREGAFRGCSSLTELVIPYSMKSIYIYAFEYCSNLKSVVFERPYYWNASSSADAYAYNGNFTVTDPAVAATCLVSTYSGNYLKWRSTKL